MEYKEFGNYKVFENGDILYKEKVVKKYLWYNFFIISKTAG